MLKLYAQLKVPEKSPLVGRTKKEIKDQFHVDIEHKHNPHPSPETRVDCSAENYRLESDKFIYFSGTREDILKFTEALLKGF